MGACPEIDALCGNGNGTDTPPAGEVIIYRLTEDELRELDARLPRERPTRADLLEDTAAGLTPAEIAAKYGKTEHHIRKLLAAYRIRPNRVPGCAAADDDLPPEPEGVPESETGEMPAGQPEPPAPAGDASVPSPPAPKEPPAKAARRRKARPKRRPARHRSTLSDLTWERYLEMKAAGMSDKAIMEAVGCGSCSTFYSWKKRAASAAGHSAPQVAPPDKPETSGESPAPSLEEPCAAPPAPPEEPEAAPSAPAPLLLTVREALARRDALLRDADALDTLAAGTCETVPLGDFARAALRRAAAWLRQDAAAVDRALDATTVAVPPAAREEDGDPRG